MNAITALDLAKLYYDSDKDKAPVTQNASISVISREERPKKPQPSLSLCQPPIPTQQTELKTYFDDEFKTYYFVPDSFNKVSTFVEKFQVDGGYAALSCGVLMKIKNLKKVGSPEERCDIIALTKNPQQVEYEGKKGTSSSSIFGKVNTLWKEFIDPLLAKPVKKWQAKQEQACNQITEELKAKIEEWHYDSFLIADETKLRELGYSQEDAKKMHLLALFYKKVPMQPLG